MIKYGLRVKGQDQLLGFICLDSTDGIYELASNQEGNIWLTDSFECADRVRTTQQDWYGAFYSTPQNPFLISETELEVVKVTISLSSVAEA